MKLKQASLLVLGMVFPYLPTTALAEQWQAELQNEWQSSAQEKSWDGVLNIRVQDMSSIGLNKDLIKSIFKDQINLNDYEVLTIKKHSEGNKIDLSTFDGYLRSVEYNDIATPRNLI